MSNAATLGQARLGASAAGEAAPSGETAAVTHQDARRLYDALRQEVQRALGAGQPAVEASLSAIAAEIDALDAEPQGAAAAWKKINKMLTDLEDVLEALMYQAD